MIGPPLASLATRGRVATRPSEAPAPNAAAGRWGLDPGLSLGLECEYSVWADGEEIDFRRIFERVVRTAAVPGFRQGRFCRILPSGHKLSCDGWKAELATPPETVRPGCAARLAADMANSRRELKDWLQAYGRRTGRRMELRGYSLHLNTPSHRCACADGFTPLFARTFGPLFIFLTNGASSRGALFRPRPGRFELPLEYVGETSRLAGIITLFQGAFQVALDACLLATAEELPSLEPDVLVPTQIRYGWRLLPESIHPDIRRLGRHTPWEHRGNVATLQAYLEAAWGAIAPRLPAHFSRSEIHQARGLIEGRMPVPMESGADPEAIRWRGRIPGELESSRLLRSLLSRDTLGKWRLSPHALFWDALVFQATADRSRPRFLVIPAPLLETSARGERDASLMRALARRARGTRPLPRVLAHIRDARELAAFDEVDLAALARSVEARGGGMKKKPKKKKPAAREDPVCVVIVDEEDGIDIHVPQTLDPQQTVGLQEPPRSETVLAQGVWAHNGAFVHEATDHQAPSLGYHFAFKRHYRSSLRYSGILGQHWDHAYNIRVVPDPPPVHRPIRGGWVEHFDPANVSGDLTYYHGTGRITRHAFASWEIRSVKWCEGEFSAVVTTYRQNDGENFEIQRYAVTEGLSPVAEPIFYRIRIAGGTRVLLNCHGYVVQIRDRNHNTMRFAYGLPFNVSTGYFVLREIFDTVGRRYRLDYQLIDGVPRIRELTDFAGRRVEFHYDGQVQLERVDLVAGDFGRPALRYRYGGGRPGLLTELCHPRDAAAAISYLRNEYDSRERVVYQRFGDPALEQASPPRRWIFDYPSATAVNVSDPEGGLWRYVLRPLGGSNVLAAASVRDEILETGGLVRRWIETRYDYDRHFHVTRIRRPGGAQDVLVYQNRNGRLGFQHRNGEYDDRLNVITHHNDLGRDALLEHTVLPGGGTAAYRRTYEYDWLFTSVRRMRAPAGTTEFLYLHGDCARPENNGNPHRINHPPQPQPDGSTLVVSEGFLYGRGGQKVSYSDPDSLAQDWAYDWAGRLVSHSHLGELAERHEYDDRGNPIRTWDDRGMLWEYRYDRRDNLVWMKDPLGHEFRYEYDLNDQRTLTRHTIADDPAPFPGVTPAPAVTVSIRTIFNRLGNWTEQVHTAGGSTRRWRRHYDSLERLVQEELPNATSGSVPDARIRYEHTVRGLVRAKIEGDGGSQPGRWEYAHDREGREVRARDPRGNETRQTFDGFGRVTELRLPGGTRVVKEYRGAQLRREWVEGLISTGPPGAGGSDLRRILRETHYRFDAHGRLLVKADKIFEPLRRTSAATSVSRESRLAQFYTAAGRLARSVDPAGNATAHDYDAHGRLRQVTLPGGHVTHYAYDGSLLISETRTLQPESGPVEQPPPQVLQLTESVRHDALGRVVAETNEYGHTTRYAYNSEGRVRARHTELGLIQYTFDAFLRLAEQVSDGANSNSNADGRIRLRYAHDANDNVIRITDDLGRVSRFTYDGRDLLLTVREPGQPLLTYARGADGGIVLASLGTGKTVTYEYGESGRVQRILQREAAGGRNEKRFGHDGLGRVTWGFDSNGSNTRGRVQVYRTYDSLGRNLTERTRIPEFQYDQSIAVSYPAGASRRRLRYPDGYQVTWDVGADGNVKDIADGQGSLIRRWHQGPGRLLETERSLHLNVAGPSAAQFELRTREGVRYNARGQPVRRTFRLTDEINRPSSGPGFQYQNLIPLDQAEGLSYHPNGHIERRTFGLQAFAHRYDGAGRLVWSQEGDGSGGSQSVEFDRDGANRLHAIIETTRQGGALRTQTTKAVTYRPQVRTRTVALGNDSVVYTFDRLGRLTDASAYRTGLGGLTTTSRGTRQFTYDADDRLARFFSTFPSGFGPTEHEARFLYDAFGRRVARIAGDPDDAFADQDREFYLFDGMQCVAEYDRNFAERRSYIFDETGQIILLWRLNAATGRLESIYPVNFMDGSPWMLVDRFAGVDRLPPVVGAAAGFVAWQEYYRHKLPLLLELHKPVPFRGTRIVRFDYASEPPDEDVVAESLLPMAMGQRVHAAEGIFYNQSRFYDPILGSFIVPDRLGSWGDPQSLGNASVYGGNNPVMCGDDGAAAWVVPPLLYLGYTLLTTAAETGVEYGVHQAIGDGSDFNWGICALRNFGVGLATNWIPGSTLGRSAGRIAANSAVRIGARAGAARLTGLAAQYGSRFVVSSGIEFGVEASPIGTNAPLGQVLLGNLVGAGLGAGLHRVLGRFTPRNYSRHLEAREIRLTRQWLMDDTIPPGAERTVSRRDGFRLLRNAARRNLDHEFGLLQTRSGFVLRKGTRSDIDFDPNVERHLAHYHPPGGTFPGGHHLPAPNDIQMAHWSGSTNNYIISNRGGRTTMTHFTWNGSGPVAITPEVLSDFTGFLSCVTRRGWGSCDGRSMIFNSIEDYNRVFFGYGPFLRGILSL